MDGNRRWSPNGQHGWKRKTLPDFVRHYEAATFPILLGERAADRLTVVPNCKRPSDVPREIGVLALDRRSRSGLDAFQIAQSGSRAFAILGEPTLPATRAVE
jgi:hypothetical protein